MRVLTSKVVPSSSAMKGVKKKSNVLKVSKRVGKSTVAEGLSNVLSDVQQSDLAYLNRELVSVPALIPWLASLIRDGELEGAFDIKVEGNQHAAF